LYRPQMSQLLFCRMQFELCSNHRFHVSYASSRSQFCQERNDDEYPKVLQCPCPKKGRPTHPPLKKLILPHILQTEVDDHLSSG
jgi:hypothetical protein